MKKHMLLGSRTDQFFRAGIFFLLTCATAVGCSGGSGSQSNEDNSSNKFLDAPATAFQMFPNHAGYVTSTPIHFPAAASWSITIGSAEFANAVSYPLIVNGRIFVTAADAGSSYGADLYALDEKTGAILWGPIFIQGTYVETNPTYDNGKVFVTGSCNSTLSEFDAASGTAGWSVQLRDTARCFSPPTALNGVVYLSSDDNFMLAINETDGRILWQQAMDGGGGYGTPTVTDQGVYVVLPCSYYRFNPKTGAILWHVTRPCAGGGSSPAAEADGKVFAADGLASTGQILDTGSGKLLNTYPRGLAPAIGNGAYYVLYGGSIVAVDLQTNQTLWTFTDPSGMITVPVVVDNYVFAGDSAGTIYALDAKTGVQVWTGDAGAPLQDPEPSLAYPLQGMAVAEHTLAVPTAQGITVWSLE